MAISMLLSIICSDIKMASLGTECAFRRKALRSGWLGRGLNGGLGRVDRLAFLLRFPQRVVSSRNSVDSKVPYFHHYSLINMAMGRYGVFNVNHLVHCVTVNVISIKGPYALTVVSWPSRILH